MEPWQFSVLLQMLLHCHLLCLWALVNLDISRQISLVSIFRQSDIDSNFNILMHIPAVCIVLKRWLYLFIFYYSQKLLYSKEDKTGVTNVIQQVLKAQKITVIFHHYIISGITWTVLTSCFFILNNTIILNTTFPRFLKK